MVSVCAFGMEDPHAPLKENLKKYIQEVRQYTGCDVSLVPPGLDPQTDGEVLVYNRFNRANTSLGKILEFQNDRWTCIRKGEYATQQHLFDAIYAQDLSKEGRVTSSNNVSIHVGRLNFPMYYYHNASKLLVYPTHADENWGRCREIKLEPGKRSFPLNLTLECAGRVITTWPMGTKDDLCERSINWIDVNKDATYCACGIHSPIFAQKKRLPEVKIIKQLQDGSYGDDPKDALTLGNQPSHTFVLDELIKDGSTYENTRVMLHDVQFISQNSLSCLTMVPGFHATKWVISPEAGAQGYACVVDVGLEDEQKSVSFGYAYNFNLLYIALRKKGPICRTFDLRIPLIVYYLENEGMPQELRQSIMYTMSQLDEPLRKNTQLVYGNFLSDTAKKMLSIFDKIGSIEGEISSAGYSEDELWSVMKPAFALQYPETRSNSSFPAYSLGLYLFKKLLLPSRKHVSFENDLTTTQLQVDCDGGICVVMERKINQPRPFEHKVSALEESFYNRYCENTDVEDVHSFTKEHAQAFINDNTIRDAAFNDEGDEITVTTMAGQQGIIQKNVDDDSWSWKTKLP